MTEIVDLTERLVAIPSHEDATAAGDAIESWLRAETDARVERDAVGNVLAYREPPGVGRGGGGDTLALVGHHDVVPPAERQTAGEGMGGEYVVEHRGGRLHGRGTADMKGSLAACMLAFRDATPPAGRTLAFASFVGEEEGGTGARHAIAEGFTPDRAVVAEGSTGYSAPGVTDIAVAHKGRRASTLVARGTAAHASEPEAGENAIYRASDAIDVVRGLDAPSATVFGESVTGSLAVTIVEGGETWNVIPERCAVTVDERTVPGDRADLGRVEATVTGVEWSVDQDLPPMACEDAAFADAALSVAREEHDRGGRAGDGSDGSDGDGSDGDDSDGVDRSSRSGTNPEHVVKPHATDAGWLAEAGTACLVCGAAEPGEAHTETESVGVDVLERCRRIYRGICEREV